MSNFNRSDHVSFLSTLLALLSELCALHLELLNKGRVSKIICTDVGPVFLFNLGSAWFLVKGKSVLKGALPLAWLFSIAVLETFLSWVTCSLTHTELRDILAVLPIAFSHLYDRAFLENSWIVGALLEAAPRSSGPKLLRHFKFKYNSLWIIYFNLNS